MGTLQLRNLTPDDEKLLTDIGVATREEFEKLGAQKSYLLILEAGHAPDPDLLHRLKGAEKDIDWQILADQAKKRAKSRFADVDEP